MWAFFASAFKTNDCTLSRHVYVMKMATRVLRILPQNEAAIRFLDYSNKRKQLYTLFRQTRLNKVAVHFLGMYSTIKAAVPPVRFLGLLNQN